MASLGNIIFSLIKSTNPFWSISAGRTSLKSSFNQDNRLSVDSDSITFFCQKPNWSRSNLLGEFEILSILKSFKVNVVGICSLAHRGEIIDFGCRYETLANINIKTWEEDNIPDWLNEIPITKPGSTGK